MSCDFFVSSLVAFQRHKLWSLVPENTWQYDYHQQLSETSTVDMLLFLGIFIYRFSTRVVHKVLHIAKSINQWLSVSKGLIKRDGEETPSTAAGKVPCWGEEGYLFSLKFNSLLNIRGSRGPIQELIQQYSICGSLVCI